MFVLVSCQLILELHLFDLKLEIREYFFILFKQLLDLIVIIVYDYQLIL